MRKALVLFALVASSALMGCSSSCGSGTSCEPKSECCRTWQPNCCNTWDWYVPCDMIEGRATRQYSPCQPPAGCGCR